MRNLGRLAQQAKRMVEERGGVDSLKEDARQLKDIATGDGTAKDKARRAAQALRQPGSRAPGAAGEPARSPTDPEATPPGSPEPPPR